MEYSTKIEKELRTLILTVGLNGICQLAMANSI